MATVLYDPRLMCRVHSLAYYARGRIGTLYLADGDCCDMAGWIALFESIAPEVEVIQTYSGRRPDTRYCRREDGWHAID
jgi:hypothetical protein